MDDGDKTGQNPAPMHPVGEIKGQSGRITADPQGLVVEKEKGVGGSRLIPWDLVADLVWTTGKLRPPYVGVALSDGSPLPTGTMDLFKSDRFVAIVPFGPERQKAELAFARLRAELHAARGEAIDPPPASPAPASPAPAFPVPAAFAAPVATQAFCSSCGLPRSGTGRFCSGCGQPFGAGTVPTATPPLAPSSQPVTPGERDLWQGSPDPILSPVGAHTVSYRITTQRLVVDHGVVGKSVDQIPLFRVKDVQVKRSLVARTRGVGTIIVTSTDPSMPTVRLEHVPNAADVADMLGRLVLDARRSTGVFAIER